MFFSLHLPHQKKLIYGGFEKYFFILILDIFSLSLMSFYQMSKKNLPTFRTNNIFQGGLIYLLNASSFSKKQIESRTLSNP